MSNVEAIKKALEGVTPEKIFVHFIENPDVMLELFSPYRIRKWNVTPFEGGVEYVPASTLEALQRENEELTKHVEELQDKVNPDKDCACSYDEADTVCAAHSPMLKAAEAKVKRLRNALNGLVEDLEMRATNGTVNCSHGVYCTARQALASTGGEHNADN